MKHRCETVKYSDPPVITLLCYMYIVYLCVFTVTLMLHVYMTFCLHSMSLKSKITQVCPSELERLVQLVMLLVHHVGLLILLDTCKQQGWNKQGWFIKLIYNYNRYFICEYFGMLIFQLIHNGR